MEFEVGEDVKRPTDPAGMREVIVATCDGKPTQAQQDREQRQRRVG